MKTRRPKRGSAPGTLATTPQGPRAHLTTSIYGPAGAQPPKEISAEALPSIKISADNKLWLDIQGRDDAATLTAVGKFFSLHPIALADAVNTPQRPKADAYPQHLLIVSHMVSLTSSATLVAEQLAIILGDNYLLTFQEREHGDVLDPVRARLASGHAPLVDAPCDALACAILDAVIDGYYPVLESVGEELERIEAALLRDALPATLQQIQTIKRMLMQIRRSLWPQRDAISGLLRDGHPLLTPNVRVYLRDCYDHVVQLLDMLETYRELASGLLDVYVSTQSNRLNEVMKVLTIISTIFMPLSFVAGLWGMNFQSIPGADLPGGFEIACGAMLLLGGSMAWVFRKRKWI